MAGVVVVDVGVAGIVVVVAVAPAFKVPRGAWLNPVGKLEDIPDIIDDKTLEGISLVEGRPVELAVLSPTRGEGFQV